MKKIIKLILFILFLIFILNLIIVLSTKNKIVNIEDIEFDDFDCILILGASVINNSPSPILEDRLNTGIDLYNKKVSKKILVSGDNISDNNYNEVNVMKDYLLDKGIPSENIFVDHYGISTYDSIYRVDKIYKAKKVLIVTQKYHLYRSLYIANSIGLEVYGVAPDKGDYTDIKSIYIREIFARCKDIIKCLFKSESKYLGEVHLIEGNGDNTNNK